MTSDTPQGQLARKLREADSQWRSSRSVRCSLTELEQRASQRQQQRHRVVLGTVVAIVIATSALLGTLTERKNSTPELGLVLQARRAAQAAAQQQQVVEAVTQAARLTALQRELDAWELETARDIQQSLLDRGAVAGLYYADRLHRSLDAPAAAAAEYRLLVRRYAGTPWAKQAARSLAALEDPL